MQCTVCRFIFEKFAQLRQLQKSLTRNAVLIVLGLSENGLQCAVAHPPSVATLLVTLSWVQATVTSILSLAGCQSEKCVHISKHLVHPLEVTPFSNVLLCRGSALHTWPRLAAKANRVKQKADLQMHSSLRAGW